MLSLCACMHAQCMGGSEGKHPPAALIELLGETQASAVPKCTPSMSSVNYHPTAAFVWVR